MGAMAPVTLAGALVQQTAEALGIIALCQMIRPGTPCVIGGFTSNVDMRTGSPAFGTPEYVHAALATAQIGRRLKLPVRTSAVNRRPAVDAQATYETELLAVGGDHEPQPPDQPRGRLARGRALRLVREDRRRRRAAARMGRDPQAGRVRRRRARRSTPSRPSRPAGISSARRTRSPATRRRSTGRSSRTGRTTRTGATRAKDRDRPRARRLEEDAGRLRAAAARRRGQGGGRRLYGQTQERLGG